MHYDPNVTRIPTAAITLEDAEMFARLQRRGQRIRVHLRMGAQTLAPTSSYNILEDIAHILVKERNLKTIGILSEKRGER